MKKILIIILAFIYLIVCTGVSINISYCMGKVVSVDLTHNSDRCGKCGNKLTGGCCKEEVKIVKLNDSHKLISNDIKIYPPAVAIHTSHFVLDTYFSSYPNLPGYKNHYPPYFPVTSLHILNCVFRI